jgi:hypothetical protein
MRSPNLLKLKLKEAVTVTLDPDDADLGEDSLAA